MGYSCITLAVQWPGCAYPRSSSSLPRHRPTIAGDYVAGGLLSGCSKYRAPQNGQSERPPLPIWRCRLLHRGQTKRLDARNIPIAHKIAPTPQSPHALRDDQAKTSVTPRSASAVPTKINALARRCRMSESFALGGGDITGRRSMAGTAPTDFQFTKMLYARPMPSGNPSQSVQTRQET